MNDNSKKFDRFVDALDKLCKEHDVHLTTSEYDVLSVWPADADADSKFFPAGIDTDRIDDHVSGSHGS